MLHPFVLCSVFSSGDYLSHTFSPFRLFYHSCEVSISGATCSHSLCFHQCLLAFCRNPQLLLMKTVSLSLLLMYLRCFTKNNSLPVYAFPSLGSDVLLLLSLLLKCIPQYAVGAVHGFKGRRTRHTHTPHSHSPSLPASASSSLWLFIRLMPAAAAGLAAVASSALSCLLSACVCPGVWRGRCLYSHV